MLVKHTPGHVSPPAYYQFQSRNSWLYWVYHVYGGVSTALLTCQLSSSCQLFSDLVLLAALSSLGGIPISAGCQGCKADPSLFFVLPCCPSDEEGGWAPVSMHRSHILHMDSSMSGIRMAGNEGPLRVCAPLRAGALCCRWSSAPGS